MKKHSYKFVLILCLGFFTRASIGQEENVTFSDFEAELRELEVSQEKIEDLALMRVEGLEHGDQADAKNAEISKDILKETPKEIYEDSVNHSQASTLPATKKETLEEKNVAPSSSTSPRIRRVRSR